MSLTTSCLSFWAIRHHKMSLQCFIDTIVSCPCPKKSLEVYYYGVNRKGSSGFVCVCIRRMHLCCNRNNLTVETPPLQRAAEARVRPPHIASFFTHSQPRLCVSTVVLWSTLKKRLSPSFFSLCVSIKLISEVGREATKDCLEITNILMIA